VYWVLVSFTYIVIHNKHKIYVLKLYPIKLNSFRKLIPVNPHLSRKEKRRKMNIRLIPLPQELNLKRPEQELKNLNFL